MKLGHIYQSIQAWQTLSALKMEPQTAYRILKYAKLVSVEYDIAEKQRVALIREITGTADGVDATIEPGTDQFADYVARFNEILATDSDLVNYNGSLFDVLAAIGKNQTNELSVQDLGKLEIFFKQS